MGSPFGVDSPKPLWARVAGSGEPPALPQLWKRRPGQRSIRADRERRSAATHDHERRRGAQGRALQSDRGYSTRSVGRRGAAATTPRGTSASTSSPRASPASTPRSSGAMIAGGTADAGSTPGTARARRAPRGASRHRAGRAVHALQDDLRAPRGLSTIRLGDRRGSYSSGMAMTTTSSSTTTPGSSCSPAPASRPRAAFPPSATPAGSGSSTAVERRRLARGVPGGPGAGVALLLAAPRGALARKPNAGHRALAAIERRLGDRFLLATQNIDGLHRRAGSERMVELHGQPLPYPLLALRPAALRGPRGLPGRQGPACGKCDARGEFASLRPHIVWFGEMLDPANIERVERFHASRRRGTAWCSSRRAPRAPCTPRRASWTGARRRRGDVARQRRARGQHRARSTTSSRGRAARCCPGCSRPEPRRRRGRGPTHSRCRALISR